MSRERIRRSEHMAFLARLRHDGWLRYEAAREASEEW
jgi:hypothetical protein